MGLFDIGLKPPTKKKTKKTTTIKKRKKKNVSEETPTRKIEMLDIGIEPRTKKQKKKAIIRENRKKGKVAEELVKLQDELSGYEVERTGRGHDFRRKKRDIFTGKVAEDTFVEVKSGNAKLSPLQKKTQKKKKGAYKVVRENPLFY